MKIFFKTIIVFYRKIHYLTREFRVELHAKTDIARIANWVVLQLRRCKTISLRLVFNLQFHAKCTSLRKPIRMQYFIQLCDSNTKLLRQV